VRARRPDDRDRPRQTELVDEAQYRRHGGLGTCPGQQLGTVLERPGQLTALARSGGNSLNGGSDGLDIERRVDAGHDLEYDVHRQPAVIRGA
jgi:hypothetical protein